MLGKILFIFIITTAFNLLMSLFAAQLVVWGLSYMHVGTGLFGPYLILAGFSTVVSASVASNSKK